MNTIVQDLKSAGVLISDGAWGTFLTQKGLKAGECPELWNIEHRDDVLAAGRAYIEAGADMIETNSFGGSRFKLEHFGLAARAAEINEAAARISREAAGDSKHVIASIGPTGKMLMMGDVTEDELYDAFKEQAVAFERGGADACCVETMSDPGEMALAVRAAKENTGLEIVATATFNAMGDGTFKTMMGASPADMAKAALEAGAAVVGGNCGQGPEGMAGIVKELRASYADVPVLVHPNAGLPVHTDEGDVFPATPEDMAALVPALLEAGANIIGGCCGTTPEHIRVIALAARAAIR